MPVPEFWKRPFRLLQPNLRKVDGRDLDPRRLVAQVIEYGANALLVNAGGIVAWYPTRLPHQPVNEFMRGDLLWNVLQEAHRQGLRVLVRLDVSKNHPELYAEHPDWFQVGADGRPRREWGMLLTCFNGPYWQQRNFELVEEIMKGYAVDGFFYNRYHHDHCLCANCRAAFRAETGLDLPEKEDWSDPAWRAFVRFRYRRVVDYTQRLSEFIRARNPRAILTVDFRLTTDNPRHLREAGWLAPRLAEKVGVVTVEAFNPLERPLPKYYLWAGEEVRMGRTFAENQPVCVILTHSEVFASRRSAQPPAQLAYDLMQIVAHGGQPAVALSGTFEQDDRKALPAIKEIYHYLRERAASYEDLRSLARVALIYSQTTMDFYGQDDAFQRALAEYRGFYEALVETHVQFDVLHDDNLEGADLSRYDLLILPNVAALSDAQAARLDAYVEQGGHLVATYETASCDQDGQARPSLALASIGCRLVERRQAQGSYWRIADRNLLPGLEATDLIALGDMFWIVEPVDAARGPLVGLRWIPPVRNNTPEYAYWEEETHIPGLVLSSFGWGEAAYLPWQVGKLYHLWGVPEYRRLILDLVRRWVPPLVTTNAPGSVEITLHHPRGDRSRALVHLLNATGWQSKPLTQVIALRDIAVWVRGDYVAARDLQSDAELPLAKEGDGVSFTVSRLDTFAAVELIGAGQQFDHFA